MMELFSSLERRVLITAACLGTLAPLKAWAQSARETTTTQGRTLSMRLFEPGPGGVGETEVPAPSLLVHKASVCGQQALEFRSATLWMPEHGHGSAPTRLVADAQSQGRCVWIEDVEFVMPGNWEIRVQLGAQDLGVFRLQVPGNHDH